MTRMTTNHRDLARKVLGGALFVALAGAAACGEEEGGASANNSGAGTAGASGSSNANSAGGSENAGGEGGNPGGAGGLGGNAASGSSGGGGSHQAAAPGWKQAFSDGGVGVNCESSFQDMVQSGAPSLTFGETTIFVGFQQYGNNQDPVFRRFDGENEAYCEHHEKQPPDGRAYGLTWDGGETAYVVYTVVGGGTDLEQKAKGGWISSYGDGGGSSKVTVLAAVEVAFGTVVAATFVPAKKSGNKTNTLVPKAAPLVLADGTIELLGGSAWAPLNPDQSGMCEPTTEYPSALDGSKDGPNYLGRFSKNLVSVVCATTAGCSKVKAPCP